MIHTERTGTGGKIVDLTIRSATDDELRRRATEGDQDAIAEQVRRRGESERAAA